MKKIVALAFLLPLFSTAQDTAATRCRLIREKDPFTKETRLSTGFIKLDGGSVTIDADSKEIDVLFTIDGADKCFDNSSIAAVFLEGVKTKMSSRNGGTMNCEGLFHFIFKNTATVPTLLQKIMTQRIDHILFTGNNKKESTITIKEEDRDKLMALATCLVNEAKKLIQ
jgi:hypothetical protein